MVFPRPIAAVVFDMDGLLIDTESLWREGMMEEARAMGLDLPLAAFKRMVGAPGTLTRQILFEQFGGDFDAEAYLDGAARRFYEMLDFETLLKAGVVELLDVLDELGLPKAIATSSPHEAVQRHLGPMGLIERFQAVIARSDYVNGKPAPDPFLTAAAALGVAPELCLALEDSHNGVRAAHAAGMMTVMVPDLLEPTEEMHDKCVHVAESLHAVKALVERAARG
jgi:HAD superfamily hydrolase (TIGR01509 family)